VFSNLSRSRTTRAPATMKSVALSF
jgi:hypothetical protein